LEFNYGICEYYYQLTDHKTGKAITGKIFNAGWSTIKNKEERGLQKFGSFMPEAART
jgi:hypothetical protein